MDYMHICSRMPVVLSCLMYPGRPLSTCFNLLLILALALVQVMWSPSAQAVTDCSASVFARTNGISSIDEDAVGPASLTVCKAGISFPGTDSGALVVSGSASSTGGGGTMSNTGVVTLPAAEAIGQITADYNATGPGNYAFSRGDTRFVYHFKLVSTGSTPPPGILHITVLFTYDWALEITGTGPDNSSLVTIQQELGIGNTPLLRQGFGVNINSIPPQLGDVLQSCGSIGGSGSCDTARLGFFNKTAFPVLVSVNAVGEDLYIDLRANALARLDIGTGLTGTSSAHARAFIDPVIEVSDEYKAYYRIEYIDGEFALVNPPPDQGNAKPLIPVLQLLLE